MATKRASRPPAAQKAQKPAASVTRTTAIALLLIGLALSAYNLALMTVKVGTLSGITDSWSTLQENYASSHDAPAVAEEPAAPAEPAPIVLASVTRYRDGEQATLQSNLVAPLIAWYETAEGPALKAVLIERKNASSRDVNVRLFFDDGAETSYLWPSTNAADGLWTPPAPDPQNE